MGRRETGAIGFLGLIGVPREEAFAMANIFGLLLIVASLPGGIIWAFGRKAEQQPRLSV